MDHSCDQYHASTKQQHNLYPATTTTTTTITNFVTQSFSSVRILLVFVFSSVPIVPLVLLSLSTLILSWVLFIVVIVLAVEQCEVICISMLSLIFLTSHNLQKAKAIKIATTTTIAVVVSAVVVAASRQTIKSTIRRTTPTTQLPLQVGASVLALQGRTKINPASAFLFNSKKRVNSVSTASNFGILQRNPSAFVIHRNQNQQEKTKIATRSSSSSSSGNQQPSLTNGSSSSSSMNNKPKAKVTYDIQECGERIRTDGKLVAFPTETVYGLGANIYNIDAIKSIFHAKERPYSDPLIVHVLEPNDAYVLWDAFRNNDTTTNAVTSNTPTTTTEEITEVRILQALCTSSLWPGPLTIVAKANTDHVNEIIMANTGYCAVRSPSNRIARQLLVYAQVPIAAPSANKFGHVSPTTCQHVYDDLYNEDVWILTDPPVEEDDGESSTQEQQQQQQHCEVGVESTVAKVEEIVTASTNTSHFMITILRQGSVSATDITDCLANAGLFVSSSAAAAAAAAAAIHNSSNQSTITVVSHSGKEYQRPVVPATTNSTISTTSSSVGTRGTDDDVKDNTHETVVDAGASVAPGQAIRHYSPNIPSYMVSDRCIIMENVNDDNVFKNAVVIDYGQKLLQWKDSCLAYRDLSSTKNSSEAARIVFDTLRWTETIPNAAVVLFPESIIGSTTRVVVVVDTDKEDPNNNNNKNKDDVDENDDDVVVADALAVAIKDKLTRAASGNVIHTLQDIHKNQN